MFSRGMYKLHGMCVHGMPKVVSVLLSFAQRKASATRVDLKIKNLGTCKQSAAMQPRASLPKVLNLSKAGGS